MLTDTLGPLLKVLVDTAHVPDRAASKRLLYADLATLFLRQEVLWADGGYTGDFGAWLQQALGWRLELVQHAGSSEFCVGSEHNK